MSVGAKGRAMAGAVALVLGVAGCASHTDRGTITATMVSGKAGFEPSAVTVHKGDKVDLTVGNSTDKTHGFDIEGYGIVRVVDPKAPPLHVRFTADKAGTFKIFCQLHPTHQPATFVVL